MKKFFIYVLVLLLGLTGLPTGIHAQAAPRVQPTDETITIVIDPGHGGNNEGTKSNGALEKAMTLTTALAMYEELCKYDNVNVYLTRTSDVTLSLAERAEFAQSVDADFLFSIHYNASLSHEVYGSEVWASLFPPYNAYGYQFGMVQMQTMQDMGLFLRGVKTRVGDDGLDYYGIIRESRELSVPAVIIEHCHVDEDRDVGYCDSAEDLAAFGRADALSVAKYFGLHSTELGVDYSSYSANELAAADANAKVQATSVDTSAPDVCQLTLKETDYSKGVATLEISAADYDSMLLYYTYSTDGGSTFSGRYSWPDSNAMDGSYRDTFTTTLQLPLDEQSDVIFRAYNLYDLSTDSNSVAVSMVPSEAVPAVGPAVVGEDKADKPETGTESSTQVSPNITVGGYTGTTTFRPDEPEETEVEKTVSFASFLAICLIIVVLLLVIVLVSQSISDRNRRKRRQRRKLEGEDSHQIR
ncbi:MAG: N-acetylmuramoyl-L-alanine amidase [Candidatus Gastranaerophilales bacterium]|nr:N-acetylmuramoyl-L-alanine amidase [Candidatus Gastranaerophilales bacterium]